MYITTSFLPSVRQVELIRKKKFDPVTFDPENETFIVHIALLSSDFDEHPSNRAQIALFKIDEALTFVLSKFADFANVFPLNITIKLPKYTGINNPTINPMKDQQPF